MAEIAETESGKISGGYSAVVQMLERFFMDENAYKDPDSREMISQDDFCEGTLAEKEYRTGADYSESSGSYYKRLASAEILSAEKESELWQEIESRYRNLRRILARFGCMYDYFLHQLESCNAPEDLTDLFLQSLFQSREQAQKFLRKLPKIRLECAQIHESLFSAYHCADHALREKLCRQGEKLFSDYPLSGENLFKVVTLLQKHHLILESSDEESCRKLLETDLLCSREYFLAAMEDLTGEIRLLDLNRERLVESNLRLVISIVRQYQNRGVPFVDLIQEGNIGLLKAIERFDYHLGHRFSTYATWWIKQSVTHAVRCQSRVIRLPVHMLTLLSRINKAEQQFLQENGREADVDEIAEILGLSRSRVSSLKRMALQPISLQAPVTSSNNDKETRLEESLQDHHDGDNPVKSLARKLLEQKLHTLLDSLPERTRQILIYRFGLNNVEPMSLNEMSQHFRVSRERIRQIENNALRHLRNPEMIALLEDYFL